MIVPVTPTEITPGTASSWVDVDVSAYVDAGNTAGVLLLIVNNNTTEYNYGVRKNGSTDTLTRVIEDNGWTFVAIGVDATDIFEANIGSTTNIDIYIIGYITNDNGVFFTNAVNKSIGTTAAWTDIDISADTGGDTALAAFLLIDEGASGNSTDWGLRKNGSTDSRVPSGGSAFDGLRGAVIGVDASEIFEMYITATNQDVYLVGYMTDGVEMFTNGIDYTAANTSGYLDVPFNNDIPIWATGAFYQFYYSPGNAVDALGAIRKNGSSFTADYQAVSIQQFGWVEVDLASVAEQRVGTTAMTLFLMGYSYTPALYTRQEASALPGTDADLTTIYSASEETDVSSDNATRVGQNTTTDNYYVIHQFKKHYEDVGYGIIITWNGQSDIAPSTSTVYLQIYNRNTASWETLDSDAATAADTDFDLTGTISSSLTDYYDSDNLVSVRVYQRETV